MHMTEGSLKWRLARFRPWEGRLLAERTLNPFVRFVPARRLRMLMNYHQEHSEELRDNELITCENFCGGNSVHIVDWQL